MSSSKADVKPGGSLFPSAYTETSKTKKQKKKKHKRHRSSSSDNSGGDQWVEAAPPAVATSSTTCTSDAAGSAPCTADPAESDGWAALLDGVTSEQTRTNRRLSKQAVRAEEERRRDAALQNLQYRPAAGSARAVGDSGAGWLRRALERAQEQARAQGRPLEELVEERWGSMDRLQQMLDAAEGRKRTSANEKSSRDSPRRGWRKGEDTGELLRHERKRRNTSGGHENSPERHKSKDRTWRKRCGSRDKMRNVDKGRDGERRSGSRDRRRSGSRDRKRSGSRDRKRRRSGSRDRRRSGSRDRRRSGSRERRQSGSRDRRRSGSRDRRRSGSRDRRGSGSRDRRSGSRDRRRSGSRERRRSGSGDRRRSRNRDRRRSGSGNRRGSDSIDSSERRSGSRDSPQRKSPERRRRMSGDRHLVAKPVGVLKTSEPEAEVSDRQLETALRPDTSRGPPLTDAQMNALAARVLKAELGGDEEEAAELKAQLETARRQRQTAAPGSGSQQQVVVVPVGAKPAASRTQRPKKVAHKAGERAQYFADDGKQDLQQMFEREKRATAADGAAALARLAARGIRQKLNDDYDADDVMTERAARAEPAADQQRREAARALALHRRAEACRRCLDSRRSLKHLVVSVGETVYLAVPAGSSLTPGHCRLLPRHHVPSLVELDEDVWEEMGRFRSALVKAFACHDQQVLFFERAAGLARQPHAELHCVPVPREAGDMAPIYFRKAIEESETEWSQNKKVVDLRGRGVRRAVPRGLPYFFVDFGMDPGFAHVIEDEELFTADFAPQVIGGMMELEPTAWRKSKDQPLQQQIAKVKEFNKIWSAHDFTKSQKSPDGLSA